MTHRSALVLKQWADDQKPAVCGLIISYLNYRFWKSKLLLKCGLYDGYQTPIFDNHLINQSLENIWSDKID